LDRETFNHIVKDAAQKKRERYESFLKSVEILSTVEPYELTQISDALKAGTFQEGDYVIREGEMGDVFYIIEEGEAYATKTMEPGKQPEKVKSYGRGDYFGELALIKGEPRAANVVAHTTLKVISLDRNSFKRLLGPIEDILKRNSDKYVKFIK
jgi:cAMP-dependent protein kinase regulator